MIEQVVTYIIIFAVCMFLFNMLSSSFDSIKNYLHDKRVEKKYRDDAREYMMQKENEEKAQKHYKYFGLFDFIFENCPDQEKLKKEYYQIIQDKLRIKYKQYGLQFYMIGKLFFECGDFRIIDALVNDLIDMFEYFEKSNDKKSIRTKVKIAIITKIGHTNFLNAQKTLLGLNAISLPNQVIVNNDFYKQYQKEQLSMFTFHPNGIVSLPENDENLEIYRLVRQG